MSILYGSIGYKMKKRIALFLTLILVMGMSLQANAASGTLSTCILSISCEDNGVGISISETASTTADEIGCRDIVLEEKVGSSWREITIAGSHETNSATHGASGVYTGAVKGRTYRASCTHYAIFDGEEKTLRSSTGEMVYN